MKHQIKCIGILLIVAMLTGNCLALAEQTENMLDVSWQGNYLDAANPKLSIQVESKAGYIQTIMTAMYDDSFDALGTDNPPAFGDYYRMGEVVVKFGETGTLVFDITNTGTPLADGAYNILVQGSGKDAELCRVQMPVWVIKPSEIPGLLASFNSCDASGVKALIDSIKNPLKLSVNAVESTERLAAFVNIRNVDYRGTFATLHDVEKAWGISEIISYLASGSVDKATLTTVFEKNASLLGIDTTSDDYKACKSDIYDAVIYNNNLANPDSIAKINTLYDEAMAIAVINNATNSTISQKLGMYYDEVGITLAYYNRLAGCNDAQTKLKIERMFVNQGFTTAKAIKDRFDGAVDTYIPAVPDGGDDDGDSLGGPGSPAIGGMTGAIDAAVTPPTLSQAFADCSKEHWAYSYIEALKESGIISGYSDGNFYPDRTVKREEFVKMAVLLCGLYDESSECDFKDVSKNEWYYAYVSSAHKEGIVNGLGEESFGIGTDISRQDVAVIVCRLLDKLGVEASTKEETKVFTDADKISDYSIESVDILTKMTIINGFEDGSFRPEASLTRAEAAKILSLVKSYINK